MSTLKANAINNISASVGGLAIDSSGNVTGALPAPNRNLLYNGAMQVSQRGTSTTSITTDGFYTADRWQFALTSMGTWTQDIQNDAPTGSGFIRSFRVLCTTADAAPAASDLMFCIQRLEGQDLQRIRKGTSSAQKLTLSFWVKSNVTGTYTVRLADNDNNRNVAATYSISASATWEKKTITFPADTTGALDNDNATSMFVAFWLGAGSDYKSGTTPTTWKTSATGDLAAGLTVNLASATNNYWQITGVQLETGDVATDFEFKSYGQELRECQRYYCIVESTGDITTGAAVSTSTIRGAVIPFPQTMRAVPTVTLATAGSSAGQIAFLTSAAQYPATIGSHAASYIAKDRVGITASGYTSAFTAGNASVFWMNTSGTVLSASAEL